MLTPFEKAFILHLVADWLLQNDWMAQNKHHITHPAAWVHAGIHAVALAVALGWLAGVTLGIVHMLIDTRLPLQWWARMYGKNLQGEHGKQVSIWTDQVLHISSIALWLLLAQYLR